jgi:hypothetical protein
MTSQQRLLVGAVLVVVLIGGGMLAMGVLGGGGDAVATPSPISVASGSPSPAPATAAPSVTAPPTEPPSASAEPTQPASVEPSRSVAPSPTHAPGEPATIVLSGLKLDAKDDPDGKDRSVGFHTDGNGDVTATVSAASPQGNVVMCLGVDGGQPDCAPTGSGTLTAAAPVGGGDFVLTLRGEGVEAPIVDVTVTFPATAPAVIIAGARFDGTGYPETNGITATVTPRRNGDLTLAADWGGHPFLYAVDLREQGGPGSVVLADQGPATRLAETLPVTAPNPWKLVLKNTEDGFGPTELDATIAWP